MKNNERNLAVRLENLSKVEQEFNTVMRKMQGQETELREWAQKYTRL